MCIDATYFTVQRIRAHKSPLFHCPVAIIVTVGNGVWLLLEENWAKRILLSAI